MEKVVWSHREPSISDRNLDNRNVFLAFLRDRHLGRDRALVPRLCLGTHSIRGSTSFHSLPAMHVSRQSLPSMGFPGRAWERAVANRRASWLFSIRLAERDGYYHAAERVDDFR